MSIEKDLKDALARRAGDVEPSPAAWQGVERAVRRSHARRAAVASVMSVVVIAALATGVALNIGGSDEPGGFSTGDPTVAPTPTPSGTPTPSRALANYRDERDGWGARYEPAWRVGRFEGHTTFAPPDTAPEQPEYQIDVWVDPQPFETWARTERAGEQIKVSSQDGFRKSADVDGEGAWSRSTHYFVDWTDPVCAARFGCPAGQEWTLRMSFYGTPEKWEAYEHVESQFIGDFSAWSDDAFPVGLTRTRYGFVNDGVAYDRHTAALVDFMDRRVEQGEAEFYLTDESKPQFGSGAPGQPGLYSFETGSGVEPWTTYRIVSREGVDANSVEFFVRLEIFDARGEEERIGVGPGLNADGKRLPSLIRFAILDNTFDAPDGP